MPNIFEGDGSGSPLRSGETPPGAMPSALGSSAQEGHGSVGMSPKEGH